MNVVPWTCCQGVIIPRDFDTVTSLIVRPHLYLVEDWLNLDISTDRQPKWKARRSHVQSHTWYFFNTVTWEPGRPWENVQWISSLPSAHIMNTQVPWKQSARPTRPREQNWSQMLRDWLLSTKIAKHEPHPPQMRSLLPLSISPAHRPLCFV